MRVRRHHLIEEAKAELDLAYNEVKRAETRIMELEFEFNERIKPHQTNGSNLAEIQDLNMEKERLRGRTYTPRTKAKLQDFRDLGASEQSGYQPSRSSPKGWLRPI